MVRLEYTCADGTPFVVEWEHDEDADRLWTLDREHFPDPLTPLAQAIGGVLGRTGGTRAYTEAGVVMPSMFRPGPRANGFTYMAGPPSDEEIARIAPGARALLGQYGSALAIWREHCLPRVREACAALQDADDSLTTAELADLEAYAMQLTMVPMLIASNDVQLLAAVCLDLFGTEAEFVSYELTQGYPNETVRADEALWRLGRTVQASAALRAALASDDPRREMARVRAAGDEPDFFERLDAFLAEFGLRSESWDITAPTWNELGAGFWAQLAQMSRDGVPSPADALAAAAARRDALIREIGDRLAGDEETRSRFHRRVQRLESYVAIREERALWQLITEGSLRQALLRRGRNLAERGVIGEADDVFYLLPDELDRADGDLSGIVKERRSEHDAWKAVTPPATVGRAAATADKNRGDAGAVLHGVPASRGVASGPARVVVDLADADQVEPGDVLVCVMTAPPWTPLFGIAAAVVTDYGDIGSHPAIAAREYGIPCVVGAQSATATIVNGATVTVDGTKGTVHIA